MLVQGLNENVDIHLVKKFLVFEKSENSSLQSVTNRYYAEPVQSIPHSYTLLPNIYFNIIFPPTLKHNDNSNWKRKIHAYILRREAGIAQAV